MTKRGKPKRKARTLPTTPNRKTDNMSGHLAPLTCVDPGQLIRGEDDHVGALILALALAFNDIQSALALGLWITKLTPPPGTHVEGGLIAGYSTQFVRLISGILHELLYFLEKSKKAVEDAEVIKLRARLLPAPAAAIAKLIAVANGVDESNGDADMRLLVKLRNSVAFHYGTKSLIKGYGGHFSTEGDDPRFDKAFLSNGPFFGATRYYFADAAASGALRNLSGEDQRELVLRLSALIKALGTGLDALVRGFVIGRCGPPRPFREREQ